MRDVVLGERVLWRGRPHLVQIPPLWRTAAAVCFAVSATAVSFALVCSIALHVSSAALVLVGAFTASLGLFSLRFSRWLSAHTEYLITETQVVCVRGPFRRTIARDGISYVRLIWSRRVAGVGDVELVRAVPTGPLRRRNVVRLSDVAAPDKLWELVTGELTTNPPNWSRNSVGQRLRTGERVLWSATSRPVRWPYLPRGNREWKTLGLALFLFVTAANLLLRSSTLIPKLWDAGLVDTPAAFLLLAGSLGLTLTLLVGAAAYLTYDAVVRPAKLLETTRYIITNKRFLIQREREELHLERERIVDVINAPALRGFRDLFLVLDGPKARALAMSGAFGEVERGARLQPVLESVEDADRAAELLLTELHADSPRATAA